MKEILLNIEKPIGIIAGLLIFFSQLIYFLDVWKNKIRPSILTWTGWAILMGTLCITQIISSGWDWSLMSITTCTIGSFAISVLAYLKNNFYVNKGDWWFLSLGGLSVILYLSSKDPWLTTIYSTFADLIIGIPILIKAYKDPDSERSSAWLISIFSWSLTLAISFNHNIIFTIFPVYVWLYSLCIVSLLYLRKRTN